MVLTAAECKLVSERRSGRRRRGHRHPPPHSLRMTSSGIETIVGDLKTFGRRARPNDGSAGGGVTVDVAPGRSGHPGESSSGPPNAGSCRRRRFGQLRSSRQRRTSSCPESTARPRQVRKLASRSPRWCRGFDGRAGTAGSCSWNSTRRSSKRSGRALLTAAWCSGGVTIWADANQECSPFRC